MPSSSHQSGHIPNAVNIPMAGLDDNATASDLLDGLPKDATLIFYCQSGVMSLRAANLAAASGEFPAAIRIYSLHGGIGRWVSAGYPIEQSER